MSLRSRVDKLARHVAPTHADGPLAGLTDSELAAVLEASGLGGLRAALRALPDEDIRHLLDLADGGRPQRFDAELERLTGRSWP